MKYVKRGKAGRPRAGVQVKNETRQSKLFLTGGIPILPGIGETDLGWSKGS
jgi:hypothetical protein